MKPITDGKNKSNTTLANNITPKALNKSLDSALAKNSVSTYPF